MAMALSFRFSSLCQHYIESENINLRTVWIVTRKTEKNSAVPSLLHELFKIQRQ